MFNIPKQAINYNSKQIFSIFSNVSEHGTDAALESFTDLDASIRQYIQNTDASQLSISGLNKHLEQQASAAQKTAVKTQLASTALNGLLSFGINAGIGTVFNLVSSAVSYLLNYKDEAVKTAREAAAAFSSSTDTMDSQKSKILELRTALESGTLTENQAAAAKSQLFDIQQQLIASYGEQARGIDLVNGSLTTQLALMDQFSEREAIQFLNQNQSGIQIAQDEMNKGQLYTLANLTDKSGEGTSQLEEIARRYQDQGLEIQDPGNGTYTITFKGDASQAQATLHLFMEDVRREIGDTELGQNVLRLSADALNRNQGILDEYQGLYLQGLSAEMIAAGTSAGTAADLFNRYTSAIQNYNNAMLSGNEDAIQSAQETYEAISADLQSEAGQNRIAPYQDLFASAYKELNTAGIQYQLFQDVLRGQSVTPTADNQAFVENLQRQAAALRDAGLSSQDFWNALQSPAGGTANPFQGILDSAVEAGLVAQGSAEDYQRLVDLLAQSGVITDSTGASLSQGAQELLSRSQASLDAISLLDQAVQEQAQNGYLSAATQSALLESSSAYAQCLTQTAGGMQLNAQAAREYAASQAEVNLQMVQAQKAAATEQYEENREAMEALAGGAEQLEGILSDSSHALEYGEIFDLSSANDALETQIGQWTDLENQIQNSTSALRRYQEAQSTPDARDHYDTVVSGMARADQLYEAGWLGQEDLVSYAQLLARNGASQEEAIAGYEENRDRLSQYLTEDTSGLMAWLEDAKTVNEEMNGIFFRIGEDGSYTFATDQLDAFADSMGMSTELLEYFLQALQDANQNIQFGQILDVTAEGAIGQLDTLIQQVNTLSEMESPAAFLSSLSQTLQAFQANGIDISGQVAQLNQLGSLYGFTVDEATLEIHYQPDTSQVEAATAEATQPDTKDIRFEPDTSQLAPASAAATEPAAVETQPALPTAGVANVTLGTYPTEIPDVYGVAHYTLGTYPTYVPSVSAKVNYTLGTVAQPPFTVNRTLPAASYLQGTPGAAGGEALTGELGRELVVYGNRWWTVGDAGAEITRIPKGAIVFNHRQTEELLKNGRTVSGGGRGRAYAAGTLSGTALASGTVSDAEDSFEELVDWIVRKLDVLQRRTEQFLNAVETSVSTAAKKANLEGAFQSMVEEMELQSQAASRYQQQADASGLSEEYRELVRSGRLDLETITDEELKKSIDSFREFYDKAQDCSQELAQLREDIRSAAQDFANLRLEETQDQVDRLDDAMSRLESAYRNAASLEEKNRLLDSQTQNQKAQLDAYNASLKDANTQLAILQELLQNAAGGRFRSALEAGEALDTTSLSGSLLVLAEKYNAYRQVQQEADQSAAEAAQAYTLALRENAAAKLENLQAELENRNRLLDTGRSRYEAQLELLEARGDSVGSAYYQRMQELARQERQALEEANQDLQRLLDQQVAQGTLVKGSDSWYRLTQQILDNANAMDQCTQSILELEQAMEEMRLGQLEQKRNAYRELTQEADFLRELLNREERVDAAGAYTQAGLASAGLMAQNLATARQSALEYQKALEELDARAAASGTDQLGNAGYQAYQEARTQLLEDYRDAISESYRYEEEMLDLIREKLDAEAEAYQEILDKRQEALKTSREQASYQKEIAQQTGNIRELERQLAALEGNDSDYARKRRKLLQAELAQAQERLEETEADRRYEIQVEVLDQDLEDFQSSLDAYAQDTQTALEDLTAQINANVSSVQSVLQGLTEETGYQISAGITGVWSTAGNAVTSYTGTVANASASITSYLQSISDAYQALAVQVEEATQSMVDSISRQNAAVTGQENGPLQQGQADNTVDSAQVSAAVNQNRSYIEGLYRELLGREPDTGGVADWLAAMAGGMSAQQVREGFLHSAEYLRKHGGSSGSAALERAVVTAQSGVNIRSSQSSANDRNLLGALPTGTEVEILQDDGHWLRVRGGGLTGWAVGKWFRRYASGTRRAGATSWAWTSDGAGDELVISPSRRAVLTPVEAGDIIPGAQLSRNLFAWGTFHPEDFLRTTGLLTHVPAAAAPVTNIHIPIQSPLVQVEGIATDQVAERMAQHVDKQLKSFGRDLKKSIQAYTVRR